jgi:pyrimidine-nucleoside phosphorylase
MNNSRLGTRSFRAVDIIAKKQRGDALGREEVSWFVGSSARGEIPDYQISAFLMAVYFKGMSLEETRHLVTAMIDSGKTLSLATIRGTKVDKHSTGGVGDKISLIVGPLVASVGVSVPMVSGRALGHTGGTLDKLESIPGFRTDLNAKEFERVVGKVGISIIGQTDEIAPADRKFYAIRDVTSTVVCLPLIVSSILSKKIASGADAVVFDMKAGRGAFMETVERACELARLLDRVASSLGMRTSAVVTRMDEPLGRCVGNAIEVREAVEVLRGSWVADLVEVSLVLGSEMLLLAGKAGNRSQARTLLRTALLGGKGLQTFRKMVRAQGGDPAFIEDLKRLPQPRYTVGIAGGSTGYVSRIDAFAIGRAALMLGAGRLESDDAVDPASGIELVKRRGDRVTKGEIVALAHAGRRPVGKACLDMATSAFEITRSRPRPKPVIIGRVTAKGLARME